MNLKNILFVLVVVVFLLNILFLQEDKKSPQDALRKPTIALSTFPLYDVAKNIAKEKIDTYMILPIGVDVHSYEPNPKQIVKLFKSDLVIFSGASLEPWISRLDFKNKVLDMSQYVTLIEMDASHHHAHEDHTHADAHTDPHYWLSINNMKKVTHKISEEMIKLDPQNKDFYQQNTLAYLKKLDALDLAYKTTLSSCKKSEILTNHNAFSYLAKEYGFEVLSLSAFSPDAEVDAKNMIRLMHDIKKDHISTIFYESFASSKAINTLAKEVGVNVEVLQPLANITKAEKGLSYNQIMSLNLLKLKKAMECR